LVDTLAYNAARRIVTSRAAPQQACQQGEQASETLLGIRCTHGHELNLEVAGSTARLPVQQAEKTEALETAQIELCGARARSILHRCERVSAHTLVTILRHTPHGKERERCSWT
jgi:hypothetical protein